MLNSVVEEQGECYPIGQLEQNQGGRLLPAFDDISYTEDAKRHCSGPIQRGCHT